ncbi:metallopeptidase TldD-related protein [Corallococcus macrosporus]|uniref:TldD/PmbA family protein n=1 Tax=Corallococcus macrosporus DSM 14697 TaxID=1189310 RepID=A0A250JQM3_9BACT|nr:metallopeptidase TldD-related protein [Corallococcus macrosporus]ATB46145.1 TldD/PmbA family protein [Corallococcus macrosporus DSM 14697]
MQGGSEEDSGVASCAGLGLRALLTSATEALASFSRRHAPSHAELFLAAERKLSLEYDAGTGRSTLNQGESLDATARVAWDARQGLWTAPVGDASALPLLLERAEQVAAPGRAGPLPGLPAMSPAAPASPPALQPDRAARWMKRFIQTAVPPGSVVQAAVLSQSAAWRALVREHGVQRVRTEWRETLFVRCETPRGALVDAVALPPDANEDAFAPLRQRLADAVDALTGPAHRVDRSLPLVLRPAVAAPLAAGLLWLLRGDVAAATPALARAVGRKLFPSALSVVDDPHHPAGPRRVPLDDEGLPTEALTLVDAGVLRAFLHAADTATRLGAPPNGRGFRPALAPPAPEAVNPWVVPGAAPALPAHYTELVARVETFTTMPRPGTVTVVAGGWEVRDGHRVRRVAPVELELPVLETFRALRGVGNDLTFFPTAEGCGTPTLVFPPLLADAPGGHAAR